jgi:hypothetical protein
MITKIDKTSKKQQEDTQIVRPPRPLYKDMLII